MPRKNFSKKKRNRGSCDMKFESLYRTPCQALPLDADFAIKQSGGSQGANHVDVSRGCVSYNVDVNAQQVAGQPVITGNPHGCLNTQIDGASSFNPPAQQEGGGASCSGVGFDLSNQIAGKPVIHNSAPNCLYGEVANPNAVVSGAELNTPSPVLSGGAKVKKARANTKKSSAKKAGSKTNKPSVKPMTKRNQKTIKKAIDNYCKNKNFKCTKKVKDQIYNKVVEKLCH